MKIIKYIFLCIFSAILCACEDNNEPKPIVCNVTFNLSSTSLEVGEHLLINDFMVSPISPSNGVDIQEIDFFLGNKKIASSQLPPFELDYEIPDLPDGEHLLQIDVHLSASGYDNTTMWIKQNIVIYKHQTTE
jgi:hypothetical protein